MNQVKFYEEIQSVRDEVKTLNSNEVKPLDTMIKEEVTKAISSIMGW